MGVVDLFGDTTYSGGASMNGLFLASVGAGAAVISMVGGLSEFLNYLTRGVSGYFADRIRRRWSLVFVGYGVNLLAVPALALAGHWQVAAGLILLQGIGRGVRKPLVQAMLSYTTKRYGKGWVYGVNTALDHTGRALGPLVVAGVLLFAEIFRTAYALLVIPAVLALVTLAVVRIRFPAPASFEQQQLPAPASSGQQKPKKGVAGFRRSYWLYLAAGAFFAAGLINFELISFHLSRNGVPHHSVPLFLVLATSVGALASLGLGRLYDRVGFPTVIVAVLATAAFSPFVFLLPAHLALVGMVLWGIGQATQDSLLAALVASVLPQGRRNLAFGLYYAGYGVGWLVGAVAAGLLYEQSRIALVLFAAGAQLASVPIFLAARTSRRVVEKATP
ncbi:MFS transporter [Micromonospora qiuiae]|uniref:MFS transporter n=1 Tax=Micromonospora qiuiae TaxID=502268 RepID=A0ABQ4JCN6_9ACTN|nr:MFS transporter [Micromonospora qiuiae]GIJ27725.1 MFS transporter [Micromonospora qiuiae]